MFIKFRSYDVIMMIYRWNEWRVIKYIREGLIIFIVLYNVYFIILFILKDSYYWKFKI